MSSSKTDKYWELRAEGMTRPNGKRRVIDTLVSAFCDRSNSSPISILELGVGAGHLLNAARQSLSSCGTVVEANGVDIDSNALALGRSLFPDIYFENGDITNMSAFGGKRFDCILAVNVLHEVYSSCLACTSSHDDASQLVCQVIRDAFFRLQPSGKLVIFDGVEVPLREDVVEIKPRSSKAREAYERFCGTYKMFEISKYVSAVGASYSMPAWVALRFLTKLKWMNTETWEQERQETYQYFSESEFSRLLMSLGCKQITTSFYSSDNYWTRQFEIVPADWSFAEHIMIRADHP